MPSIFMKCEGNNAPDGESKEQNHVDWIVLNSCDFEATRSVPENARAAQRTRGETDLANVNGEMDQNRASMKMMQNAASGVIYDKVTIHFCRAGSDASSGMETYWEVILEDALVVKYATTASGEDVPTDTFEFNYSKIRMDYKIADTKGALTKDSDFKWDKELSQMA